MENRRLQWFLVAIGAGLVFGLILGWSVFPRRAANLPLQDLREDYLVDYSLMVATVYSQDKDVDAARIRLMEVAPELKDMIELLELAMAHPVLDGKTNDIQTLGLLLNALRGGTSFEYQGRAA